MIMIIVIHSKYFPFADWFKPHAYFTITSCCSPNLNQWHQDDVKSAARCRLLHCWPRKPDHNGKTPWRRKKYFEWINLEGCYPPWPLASMHNTLLDLQNSSYPTQPHSIIANKYILKQWILLNTRGDWLVKIQISCAIYLRATREKMASRSAALTSEEIIQIKFLWCVSSHCFSIY